MNTDKTESENLTEDQSLQVIRDMIDVSRKKMNHDGILIIVWGWIMTVSYLLMYLTNTTAMTYLLSRLIHWTGNLLLFGAVLFTAWFIFKQRQKVRTYIGSSLRYVWICMICCLMLTNMILFNSLHELNLKLQHPVFMLFIAYTIVISGIMLRYNLLIMGGMLFAAAAYIASRFELNTQILIEAISWLAGFVIPGHFLFARRKK